jgi:hypothetical protein
VPAFLRPTWITWTVVLLPIAVAPLLNLLGFQSPLFLLSLLAVEIPFALLYPLRRLGLPVGRRGDWFGYALPSGLGWTLIALVDLAALYLPGCFVSAAWMRARARRGTGVAR